MSERRIKKEVQDAAKKLEDFRRRQKQALIDAVERAEKDRQQAAAEQLEGERKKKAIWPGYSHEETK